MPQPCEGPLTALRPVAHLPLAAAMADSPDDAEVVYEQDIIDLDAEEVDPVEKIIKAMDPKKKNADEDTGDDTPPPDAKGDADKPGMKKMTKKAPKKRKFMIGHKLFLIALAATHTQQFLYTHYDITLSHISPWKKSAPAWKEEIKPSLPPPEEGGGFSKKNPSYACRYREPGAGLGCSMPDLEKELNVWFKDKQDNDVTVYKLNLKDQAVTIAKRMKLPVSKLSAKWFNEGFCQRHGITFNTAKRRTRKSQAEIVSAANSFFHFLVFIMTLLVFHPDRIFHMDEKPLAFGGRVADMKTATKKGSDHKQEEKGKYDQDVTVSFTESSNVSEVWFLAVFMPVWRKAIAPFMTDSLPVLLILDSC
eukprot:gene1252-9905_t